MWKATLDSFSGDQQMTPWKPTRRLSAEPRKGTSGLCECSGIAPAPRVDAVVRRIAGDAEVAGDIAQEVWIQVFRALPGWRKEAKFSTWIHRIAVNRTLNALRSVRRLKKLERELDEHSATVEHYPVIEAVYAGSPAEKGGLLAGDTLVAGRRQRGCAE